MNAEELDTNGCMCLVEAIVKRAKMDFMKSDPHSRTHNETERFFKSRYFSALTGLDGCLVLGALQEAYEKKRKRGRK